jgi:hypothetical protein
MSEKLAEYAQQENSYVIAMLIGRAPKTGEDPMELAKRNVQATAECFGADSLLYAMAVNTHAFGLMFNNRPKEALAALDSASESFVDSPPSDLVAEVVALERRGLRARIAIAGGSDIVSELETCFRLNSDGLSRKQRLEQIVATFRAVVAPERLTPLAQILFYQIASVLQTACASLMFSRAPRDLEQVLRRLNGS